MVSQWQLKLSKEAKVNLVTLTNYEAVLDSALKTGYINEEDVPVLDNWRKRSGSLGGRQISYSFKTNII